MRRDKDEEEKKQDRLRGFGNTSCRMVSDRNVGYVLCHELGIKKGEKIMQEYVDDLYLKLSKEEFIEEYVKVRNKQHTLKDYDLYIENSAIVRAFEAQIAFVAIFERGYRYDKDKNMIVKSE